MLDLLSRFQHEPTALAVRAERAFLGRLNGGCQVPLGAYASINKTAANQRCHCSLLTGMVGTPDGDMLKETASGSDPEALGLLVADKLIAQGAERILLR